MNTLGFTARYFPLPHPTSTPTAPSGSSFKNRSTIGHGCIVLVMWAASLYDVDDAHLVSCRRKMGCYLLVDSVHMLLLIICALCFRFRHTEQCNGKVEVTGRGLWEGHDRPMMCDAKALNVDGERSLLRLPQFSSTHDTHDILHSNSFAERV
jgi:hypothetical protein